MSNAKLVIGVIGGAGWLGAAITKAVLDSPDFIDTQMILSYRNQIPREESSRVTTTQNNQWLVDHSDYIILSVRPQDWNNIDIDLKGKPIISVMAGITADQIANEMNTSKVIRTLPNSAASVKQSYTPWYTDDACTSKELSTIAKILSAFGEQDRCQTEDQIDFLTAISGTGPAYPALLAQALEQSATNHGIDPHIARRAANSVIRGSGFLLKDLSASPRELVSVFENYGGITQTGLLSMKEDRFIETVNIGVKAAYDETKRLSE